MFRLNLSQIQIRVKLFLHFIDTESRSNPRQQQTEPISKTCQEERSRNDRYDNKFHATTIDIDLDPCQLFFCLVCSVRICTEKDTSNPLGSLLFDFHPQIRRSASDPQIRRSASDPQIRRSASDPQIRRFSRRSVQFVYSLSFSCFSCYLVVFSLFPISFYLVCFWFLFSPKKSPLSGAQSYGIWQLIKIAKASIASKIIALTLLLQHCEPQLERRYQLANESDSLLQQFAWFLQ